MHVRAIDRTEILDICYLWPLLGDPVRDTSSPTGEHICGVFSKSLRASQSYWADTCDGRTYRRTNGRFDYYLPPSGHTDIPELRKNSVPTSMFLSNKKAILCCTPFYNACHVTLSLTDTLEFERLYFFAQSILEVKSCVILYAFPEIARQKQCSKTRNTTCILRMVNSKYIKKIHSRLNTSLFYSKGIIIIKQIFTISPDLPLSKNINDYFVTNLSQRKTDKLLNYF